MNQAIVLALLGTVYGNPFPLKYSGSKENCYTCNKKIPPGKAGRSCQECRDANRVRQSGPC